MKPTAKIFILSFFLALNLPLKGAVTPDSYVVIFEKDTAFTVTDSLFYAISQKIVFPVNTYTIGSVVKPSCIPSLLRHIIS